MLRRSTQRGIHAFRSQPSFRYGKEMGLVMVNETSSASSCVIVRSILFPLAVLLVISNGRGTQHSWSASWDYFENVTHIFGNEKNM